MRNFLFVLLLFNITASALSQSLTVSPGWTVSLATTNITEAGLDYPAGNLVSGTSQSLVRVTANISSVSYIYIQKSDISWDSRLNFFIKRTGSGTGGVGFSVTNGTTNLQVSNTPQYFFEVRTGLGTQVSNIPIQYLISGFTVLLPVKAYTTSLLYTITN